MKGAAPLGQSMQTLSEHLSPYSKGGSVSKLHWEDLSSVIEPQINAAGTHIWPFNPSFPIDVRFFTLDGFDQLRMNRHDYFELYYVSSGRGQFQVQDRSLPINE